MEDELTLDEPLADKPSEFIRDSIIDLIATEKDLRYKVNMSEWYNPAKYDPSYTDTKVQCFACWAGGVMGRRTNHRYLGRQLGPANFSERDKEKLIALDRFRTGDVNAGLQCMGFSSPKDKKLDRKPVHYRTNPEGFKRQMLALAQDLEDCGL